MEYYMLNKARGYITATCDERRETVFDRLPPTFAERLFAVGRLDLDTEGLLLITNDGPLTARLLHPDSHTPKTYELYCVGSLDEEGERRLEEGVYLDRDKTHISRPARFCRLGEGVLSEIVVHLGGRDLALARRRPDTPVLHATLTVTEGRKHQIKRMLLAVGCRVVWLRRVSFGPLALDPTLSAGDYRALTEEEIAALYTQAYPDGTPEKAKENVKSG